MPLEYRLVKDEENMVALVNTMANKLQGLDTERIDDYIEQNPEDIKGYAIKAWYLQNEDIELGLQTLDKAIDKFGEKGMLYHIKGILYIRKENIEQACENFKKAIKINPVNIEALISYSNILDRQGNYEQAKECCKQIIEINPEIEFGWFGLAKSEYHLKDFKNALKHINAALFTCEKEGFIIGIGYAPNIKCSYLAFKAELLIRLGKIDSGLKEYNKAFEEHEKEAIEMMDETARSLIVSKKMNESKLVLEKLIQLSPNAKNNISIFYGLGSLYLAKMQIEKIDKLFEGAIKAGFHPYVALDKKAELYTDFGLIDKAIETCEDSIKRTGITEPAMKIIQLAMLTGNVEKIEQYTELISKDKNFMLLMKSLHDSNPEILN